MDLQGKLLQKVQVNRRDSQTPFEIMVPELPVGVYVVEMQSGSEIKRTKLMKR